MNIIAKWWFWLPPYKVWIVDICIFLVSVNNSRQNFSVSFEIYYVWYDVVFVWLNILVLTAVTSQLITVSTTASVYNHPQFYTLPHSLTNSTINVLTSHITPNNIPPQIAQCHCSNNLTLFHLSSVTTLTFGAKFLNYLKLSQAIQFFCVLHIFSLFTFIFFCNCTLM